MLIPNLLPEEAAEAAETDWASDAEGCERMSRDQLFNCLFELADMYTTGIDGGAYATWLLRLFKRITVRCVTMWAACLPVST